MTLVQSLCDTFGAGQVAIYPVNPSDTSSDFVIRCGMTQVLGPKNPLVSKQVFGKVFFMCFYECHPRAIRTGP